MNKQPFYHRAIILFTATRDITKEELEASLRIKRGGHKSFAVTDVITESIEVEECNAEPGDPADLL